MSSAPATRDDRIAPESLPPVLAADESALRFMALRQVERVRAFKLHLAAFVVVTILTAGVWALTEYQNADGWPERLNDNGAPGSWNPWILWVVLAWSLIVAVHGLVTYFRRATTQAELEREVARLRSRG